MGGYDLLVSKDGVPGISPFQREEVRRVFASPLTLHPLR